MIPIRLIAGVSTLLLGCAVATVSTAQQAPAASSSSTAANSDGLETIVVTAGKRVEDIQSVPYSISAVSGAELESRHIDNVEDIARTVPGISFGAGGNAGKDTITIRGISSQ
ncbi:MAG TPA: TonB-dependent receptor plug domain-containing protein, partial [Steroidobacteraceae bacterium]|nr:TonB-dependent receptor plug domain-containing protein [Steroidobacteraceae bacterium]